MKALVKDIMSEDILTVDIFDTIKKADQSMTDENYRHIAVTENGKLVGIITQKKIMEYRLRELYENNDATFFDDKILDYEKIMKREPSILYSEDSLEKAIRIMMNKRIDYIPVVNWEHNIIGSVSFMDILLYLNGKIQEGII